MHTVDTLKKEIKANRIKNFYVFVGDERQLLFKYLDKIDPKYRKTDSIDNVTKKMTSLGLFNTKVTYVVDNDKAVLDLNLAQLQSITKVNRLIVIFNSVDSRLKFFKAVSDYTYEFKKMTAAALAAYVQASVDVDKELAKLIAERCNLDLGRVELESDKLKHFKSIDRRLVDELIIPSSEDVVFKMVECVVCNEPISAYRYLEDLKIRKEPIIKIISILYTNFRSLLLVQGLSNKPSKEIAESTGINAWVVGNLKPMTGKFELPKILGILRKIQSTEIAIKTGRVNEAVGLDWLLIQILS